MTPTTSGKDILTGAFQAAVEAAKPENTLALYVPSKPRGRTVVVGAGKAGARMAAALEACWDGPLEGVVVVPYGSGQKSGRIEIVEASHPIPDMAGLAASHRLLGAVAGLVSDDLVIALVSGGGSALLPLPAEGISLEEEAEVNRVLLASGMPIESMNIIRKHISMIKGGRLAAAAAPAKIVSLVISDVPGDVPAYIASGPTIPDRTTRNDALHLVGVYGLQLPHSVMSYLQSPMADAPMPDDARFERNEVHVIGSAGVSLEAAAAYCRNLGLQTAILSDSIEGEARDVGGVHAAIAREVSGRDRPFSKPVMLLSGGETTVTIKSRGKGGRNTEFLAAFALGIDGRSGIEALAADTDGIDGTEASAGAFADGSSCSRMRQAGINLGEALQANNTWAAFNGVGDLFTTGPTGTNVNDFRAILIR